MRGLDYNFMGLCQRRASPHWGSRVRMWMRRSWFPSWQFASAKYYVTYIFGYKNGKKISKNLICILSAKKHILSKCVWLTFFFSSLIKWIRLCIRWQCFVSPVRPSVAVGSDLLTTFCFLEKEETYSNPHHQLESIVRTKL